MTKIKRKFGLIGYPLSHSFSPSYFASKFESLNILDAEYKLYPLENISMVQKLLTSEIAGINVTIPYKESVIQYLDYLSPESCAIGAVNTIKIVNGKSIGYNTDVFGFEESLLRIANGSFPERALILGTGGAAKAVKFVLNKNGVEYLTISRTAGDLRYTDLDNSIITTHKLIVNTTPLGMFPNIESCPDIPYSAISDNHILYDLVYNPEKTLFLKRGEERNARIKNGHDMLKLQAEKSWKIWNESI